MLDLKLFRLPTVTVGMFTIGVVMSCYAGFLLILTLHLQGALRFTPLHAGLIFAIYACGFASASLTWTRAPQRARAWLPPSGLLTMAAGTFGVGLVARDGGWSTAAAAPLLFLAGAGHALGFSPLAHRLTNSVRAAQAADLSGLILTANVLSQVVGVAGPGGIYLSLEGHGSGSALATTTAVLAALLALAAATASFCTSPSCLARPARDT